MPFADIGGGQYTDSSGLFNGLNATSTLKGKYVGITDNCGAISLSTSSGDLNFSSGGGTNCSTPGIEGAGNTRAARTTYHWATKGKIKALSFYPSNPWLSQQLNCNTNINNYCNASWDGSSLNFQRAGNGCFNTGELPGVILHEFGHGFDDNDGIKIYSKGTSEVHADFTSASILHDSCIFRGLYSSNSNGYGDPNLDCNGARELDWAKHQSGKPHTPEDLISNSCPGCTNYACNRVNYGGPCGFEEHCEALIMGEALWDLATRDLISLGIDSATAWQIADRLFWATRSTTNMGYSCPTLFSTNGCGITNYFSALRVADDCDGDLSNGTPHSSAIFSAFDRHKISCPYFVNTDQLNCCPSFSPDPINLNGLRGHNSVTLNWNPVSNVTSYNILKNEISCEAGFFNIGNVGADAINFVDPSAQNDIAYYYRIQPVGDTQACTGALSNCVSITPQSCAGSLSLNKSSYSCNDTIILNLKDGDLSGQGSKQILIWSDTESSPETVNLTENPSNSGYFSGIFPATANPPLNGDGKLSISNGDTITARYYDSSFCGNPRNIDIKAKANCGGLIISGVQVLDIDGTSAKVIWTTNRPATSLVKYDTIRPPISGSKSDNNKTINHSLIIAGLFPCQHTILK